MLRWGIRLLLSAVLLFGGFFVLVILRRLFVVNQGFSMQGSMYAAGFVTFVLIVVGWIGIWQGMVHWNATRKTGTAVIVPAAQLFGFPLGILIAAGDRDAAWAFSALMPMGLFLIGTIAF